MAYDSKDRRLDHRELGAVLAGLRLWQHHLDGTKPIWDGLDNIATEGGDLTPLTCEEIDELCELLNSENG